MYASNKKQANNHRSCCRLTISLFSIVFNCPYRNAFLYFEFYLKFGKKIVEIENMGYDKDRLKLNLVKIKVRFSKKAESN